MLKKVKALLLVVTMVWLSLVCLSSYAMAIMIGLTNEELTRQSSVVVIGNVMDKQSSWNSEGTTIYTMVTIIVNEVIRGKLSQQTLTLRYEGGEVEGIGLRVSDTPQFEKNEDVLLFLKPLQHAVTERDYSSAALFYVVGSGQGKYTIEMNAIATRGGFSIVNNNNGSTFKNVYSLNELKEQIRSVQ
ncbi:MAG: hypothetical protein HQL06_10310 [Nitrospirae bacterium]|nr:hypothetical protein [Nitrospirota bacterium]